MSSQRTFRGANRLALSLLALLFCLNATAFESLYLNPANGFGDLPIGSEGIVSIETKANQSASYEFSLPSDAREFSIRLRFANRRLLKDHKPLFTLTLEGTDTLSLTVRPAATEATGVDRVEAMQVDATLNGRAFDAFTFSRNINNEGGENLLSINKIASLIEVAIGAEAVVPAHRLPLIENPGFTSLRLCVPPKSSLSISELTVTTPESQHAELFGEPTLFPTYEPDNLPETGLPLEGYWSMYDYDMESELAGISEDYEFYIAGRRNGDEGPIEYDLIYLGGGPKEARMEPGAVKARMRDSRFPGVWEVEWVAVDGTHLRRGIRMTLSENQLLNFRFAPQNSSFRLRRVQNEK